MSNDAIEKWIQIGRSRAETAIKDRMADLPERLAAQAERTGRPLGASLRTARPEDLIQELLAAASPANYLIADGDSWFKYVSCGLWATDIVAGLENHGYEVKSYAEAGAKIQVMAKPGNAALYLHAIETALANKKIPKAILLCGGGNDVVGDNNLANLLNESSAPTRGLKNEELNNLINKDLQGAYATIISAINTLARTYLNGAALPILVHGYDYPFPTGDGHWCTGRGPWLQPSFIEKGYSDPAECRGMAKELIKRFNEMLAGLSTVSGLRDVTYVDLRGMLPNESDWDNELHPRKPGFVKITTEFMRKGGL